MHRGKVDPRVSELPQGNELSRDHVNRPIVVMVVSTVANIFQTLFQAALIHVNTLNTASQA